MISPQFPAEEINEGFDSSSKEKKKETETGIEVKAESEGEDEDLPCYASFAEVTKALEEAFRKDSALNKKLLSYTLRQVRLIFGKDCAGIKSADDILQEVFESIINLKRKWYKKKTPNIVNLILMCIVSFVRNEFRRQNGKINQVYIDRYDPDGELKDNSLYELVKKCMYEDLKNREFIERVEDLKEKCLREMEEKNDVEGYCVLEEIIESTYTIDAADLNIQIARKLNIKVKDVENAKRRIGRMAKNIRF